MGRRPDGDAPRRRIRAIALGLLVLLAVAVAASLAGAWWGLRSADGARWALARVPGLTVEGVEGAVDGDALRIRRLVWRGPAGQLEIDDLAIEHPRWRVRPAPSQWVRLDADAVSATRVRWRSSGDGGNTPPVLPGSLRWPVGFEAPVSVARLEVDAQAALTDVHARVGLGADGGAFHRVDDLRLTSGGGRVTAGRARIAADAPFALDLEGEAQGGIDRWAWQVHATAEGTLRRLGVRARLATDGGAAVELQAALQPFVAWPLEALAATTRSLDLSTLSPAWPRTHIEGELALDSSGRTQPLRIRGTLRNAQPGRWDEGRLPVARIEVDVAGRLDAPERVAIHRLQVDAADARGAAGVLTATGEWLSHALTLDLRADAVQPQRIDGRAAAMTLSGPLAVRVDGLPSPDPAAVEPTAALGIAAEGRLEGKLDAAPRPVEVTLRARADADAVSVGPLVARAGDARMELRVDARRDGPRWTVSPQATLTDFDPSVWWQGPADSAWRRGPHRLNGTLEAQVSVPADAATLEAVRAGARGQATVSLRAPSQLAGVPVDGHLRVTDAPATHWIGTLHIGGNRFAIDGRFDLAGPGDGDRWSLDIDAPALAALAPLVRLAPAAAGWAPGAGAVVARVELAGRGAHLSTRGSAQIAGLRVGPLAVAAGDGEWNIARAIDAPVHARVDLRDAAWDGRRLRSGHAEIDGTRAAHRIAVDAVVPAAPSEGVARILDLGEATSTRLTLRAEGALAAEGDGQRWAGVVHELGVRGDTSAARSDAAPAQVATGTVTAASSAAASTAAATASAPVASATAAGRPPSTDWLQGRALRGELTLSGDGALRRLRVEPGQLQLAGGLALRWDEMLYDGPTGVWQARARIDGIRAAPLLARWQPDLGWDGDLRLGARIDVRAAERFDADVVIEREDGDLRVLDPTGQPLPLGLTDLRLALAAHDGTWYFTQALAGRALGEAGGALRARTSPAARWPPADAPVDGTLQARVANLEIWGAWVPPGWRLQGELSTTASLGGRFGAPEMTGVLEGHGLGVRNLLEGVAVHDGDLRVRLTGETAEIERFVVRAGDGEVAVSGRATLGESPRATLALKADRFQVLGRVDRRLSASGSADLDLQAQRIALKGAFTVDESLFDVSRADAPTLDADVVVRRTGDHEPTDAAEATRRRAPSAEREVDVAVQIDLGDHLQVRGRGVDTRVAGRLRITAPQGRPAVQGTVRAVDGTYAAYGQKLRIARGRLVFAGPIDNPRLDILALRPDLDIEVGVAITGTAQSPRVRLHSVPDMNDSDKLAWLVLGRDPGGLDREDAALVQRTALALLAGENGSPDSFAKRFGLDTLSVRQADSGDVRETIVTIGKQLSSRWYVGYERGVNATVGTWQLVYRIAQRFTLRLQTGLEDAIDAIWTVRVK